MRYFYHTADKQARLAHSHYRDPAYDGHGAVIFGEEVQGMKIEYADRLWEWSPEKSDAARKIAGDMQTAAGIERYLSAYFDRSIELLSIRTGTRPDNRYPWYAYGFRFTDENK